MAVPAAAQAAASARVASGVVKATTTSASAAAMAGWTSTPRRPRPRALAGVAAQPLVAGPLAGRGQLQVVGVEDEVSQTLAHAAPETADGDADGHQYSG